MIVAATGEALRLLLGRTRLMPRRHLDRGHRLEAFHHLRDQRRSDPVIGEAALARDGKEPRINELRQMLTRGRPRHASEERELGAGERLAAHQRGQHRGARGVAHERCNLDQIGGGNHGVILPPQRSARQVTTFRPAPNR